MKILKYFFEKEILVVWHPESPGERVVVERNWFGRLFKPTAFATLSESLKYSQKLMNDKVICPVCGYYCNGKGGYGCIHKNDM